MSSEVFSEERKSEIESGNYIESVNGGGVYIQSKNIIFRQENKQYSSRFYKKNENSKASERERLVFTILGEIDSIDEAKLESLINVLKQLAGDENIVLVDIKKGSIKLTIDAQPSTIQKLFEYFQNGDLNDLDGHKIEHIQLIKVFKQNLVAELQEQGGRNLNLKDIDLCNEDLSNVDFSRINLENANLSGSNLENANLYGANLSGSNLENANLYGANLSDADLSKANFTDAVVNRTNFLNAKVRRESLTTYQRSVAIDLPKQITTNNHDIGESKLVDIPVDRMTLRQLRRIASQYGIARYSRMRREALIDTIQKAQLAISNISNFGIPNDTLHAQDAVSTSEYTSVIEGIIDFTLASVDKNINNLPDIYVDDQIVLMPRDPLCVFLYWHVSDERKKQLQAQGGEQIAIRIYDATYIDLNHQAPHSVQEFPVDELARNWYLPLPVSDRDYVAEIGYRCGDGRWLVLARSSPVHVPPAYPSDWIDDQFITVDWDMDLRGKQLVTLVPPERKLVAPTESNAIYDEIFGMAESAEDLRVAGSMFGSMQQVPEETLSSFVFPSGVGMWALPTVSGLNMSGVGMFSASAAPVRPRKFWLVADAELIVYGATEPGATVIIGGEPIQLKPDGTFRYQMSFQDGLIDYPIMAVDADGEQTRSIHMKFTRETPARHTNTKEAAVLEWLVPAEPTSPTQAQGEGTDVVPLQTDVTASAPAAAQGHWVDESSMLAFPPPFVVASSYAYEELQLSSPPALVPPVLEELEFGSIDIPTMVDEEFSIDNS